MAKSIRSKRRRKMRAIKRERYGVKELERLKNTLAHDNVKKEIDEVMTDLNDVIVVTDAKTIKENVQNNETIESMDDDSVKHIYNKKTLRDQFGSYPVWLNKKKNRKQKKTKKINKRGKIKTKRN